MAFEELEEEPSARLELSRVTTASHVAKSLGAVDPV
jgi:hypothetical protein